MTSNTFNNHHFYYLMAACLIFSSCIPVVNGKKNGDEKINSRYEGEIKNGVPNGKGTLFFPNGEKQEVEFKNGQF